MASRHVLPEHGCIQKAGGDDLLSLLPHGILLFTVVTLGFGDEG